MAKRKSSKDTRPDFLRDNGDRIEKISANDIWSAITLKHEPTRKVVGFLLVVFSAVLAIAFTSFFFSWKLDQSLMTRSDQFTVVGEVTSNEKCECNFGELTWLKVDGPDTDPNACTT